MAATEKGVWGLQDVRDKQLASEWDYTEPYAMFSWGYQQYSGQVGDNSRTNRSSPMQIPGDPSWKTIVQSYSSQRIATKDDGTIWSWGGDSYGKQGTNTVQTASSPTQIGSGTDWSNEISRGDAFASAIKTDGTLWAWAQTGLLKADNSTYWNKFSSPVQIGSGTSWDTTDGRLIKSGSAWIAVQSI